jgi:glycosyltransferase involved in cell wall biosynthesis
MNMPLPASVMIDAYNLDLEQGTGVATYARNLSYCLHELGCEVGVLHGRRIAGPSDPLLREVTFFDTAGKPPKWRQRLQNVTESILAPGGFAGSATAVQLADRVIAPELRRRMAYYDTLWNAPDLYSRAQRQFTSWKGIQRVQMERPPEIMHWTYPLPLRLSGAKNIYTLHDLVPLRLPYTTLDRKRRYLRLMRRIVAEADHIVTVSECSRRDIIQLLNADPARVTNTFQSVSLPAHLTNKPLSVASREIESTFKLTAQGYYLFVGAIEPKKNVARLIEAYLGSGSQLPLVLAGPRAWKADQELRMYLGDELRLRDRIRLINYVPQSVLVNLIRCARALFFPSVYEGFGLPVLEAMLLGTPVLSSTTGSIPEIAGDAALLVDPYDTNAIAESIRLLDTSDTLCQDLAVRGRDRAALFSPERYAERVGALYTNIARQGHREALP